jgi:pimeloyl-ACP methyl ester carboxylesterase
VPVQAGLPDQALMHVLYLHGFASSAKSTKAAFFAAKLVAHGVIVHIPDFNEPDFSTLTITRMLDQVGSEVASIDDEDAIVPIGSSLGGVVAVQTALRYPARVSRMVLLAPALEFKGEHLETLGDRSVAEWARTQRLDVFHYGFGRVMPVHYELFTDASRYDCLAAQPAMPIQIFQGRRDTAVDPRMVQQWASLRPNVELHLLDDDHQLAASLDVIWKEMRRFLGL